MAFIEYHAPPNELDVHITDDRITTGVGTYFDRHISFALFSPMDRVSIGSYCSIAKDVTIFGGGNHIMTRATMYPFMWYAFWTDGDPALKYYDGEEPTPTVIKNDVWIGYGATIMGGVTVGNGAVIGAQAVIARDVPDYAVAVGNPGRVIRYRFRPETIGRLLELSWWDWSRDKIHANLDLLYENPDSWPAEIKVYEP